MIDVRIGSISWNAVQYKIMITALNRYIEILVAKPLTPPIDDALKYSFELRSQLEKAMNRCTDKNITSEGWLSIKDYQFLSDLLHKYWGARRQEYKEKSNHVSVEGELYYEEKELEQIREILLAEVFMKIEEKHERIRLLTNSLYIQPDVIKRKNHSSHSVTYINQTIENNYGQAIANNPGIVNQTNNPEITEKLKSLITKVLEADIASKDKAEYIADLEIMMAESRKEKPSRALFELKMPVMERLSQIAQIGSFVHQVWPSLEKFINNLPNFS
jgi:hypothetical protein